jgi:hypothetical protein
MGACRAVDELAGDPHLGSALAHAALQQITHAEFAADLLHVHRPALVGEARISRDHKEPAQARERRDDLLDHAIGKILLFGIAAHVHEGKNCNRGLVGQSESRHCDS